MFSLVDVETGNWVGSHRTLREALDAVRAEVDRYGATSIEVSSLGLFQSRGLGKGAAATGPALVALAMRGSRSHARKRAAA